MKRSEQGGAIVGFLIASAVLTLLLVGGAYAVRHQPGWVSKEKSSSSQVATTGSSEKSDQPADGDKKTTKDETKSDTTQPADTPKQTTPDTPAASSQPSGSPVAQDSATSSQSVQTLPQTGPIDVLASLVAVGAVTFALAIYVRSRRDFAHL